MTDKNFYGIIIIERGNVKCGSSGFLHTSVCVAILAPYIITEFANAILRMSDKKWLRGIAPTKLFNMAQTNTGASFIVYIAVLLILGVVVYFIGGLKHETY